MDKTGDSRIRRGRKPMSKKAATTAPTYEYKLDKITFIVEPVYREDSGKSIHDFILNLMKNDVEKS